MNIWIYNIYADKTLMYKYIAPLHIDKASIYEYTI